MNAIKNKEDVLKVLKSGTSEERLKFWEDLPPNSFKDAATSLFASDNPSMVILALTSPIQQYCEGSAPEYGAVLAEALHEYAVEIWNFTPNHGLNSTTLSNLAYYHVKALSLIGRSEAVIAMADHYIKFYKDFGDYENLPSLKVLKIGALVNLQRIDEAEESLQGDLSLLEHPIVGIEARRLKGWIDQYRADPTQLRAQAKSAPEPPSSQSLLNIMKTAIGLGFEDEAGKELQQEVDQLNTSHSISSISFKDPRKYDQEDIKQYDQMLDILNRGETFLGKGSSDSELAVRNKIRNATAIFVRGTPAPEAIERSLSILNSSLKWAQDHQVIGLEQDHQVTELENDAYWGLYLCNSRLGRPSEAADALIQLRKSLEGMRHGIQDPFKRGGVFSAYPYLFNALCEQLQKAGRAKDLLEAIESSKGRVIADRLTTQTDAIVSDKAIYDSVKRLPELTQREQFHYLTYFVDEERVYASFVSKQGKVYASDPVPIKNSALRNAAENVDPKNWGESTPNISEYLAPLVAWLNNLLKQDILQKDDHICYSSDEDFNNVPLQYLRFKDGILLDWFSLSRVHSVFHLDLVLKKEKSPPPNQYLGVVVPFLEQSGDKKFIACLDAPTQWLEENAHGHSVHLSDATLDRVTTETLSHRVVHFSTHGEFPKEGNPYHDSFLFLADEHGLPSKEKAIKELKGKLTPSTILEKQINLQDSHVSLMACVTGLAKEGIAGDALGLDWALIQAGASSLISTHWHVNVVCAAHFFMRFYEKWIKDRQSRASAYRATILELLNQNYTQRSLRNWTAFSLTGDFR